MCPLTFVSCGQANLPRKPTVSVSGQVYVDDRPAAGLQVYCRDVQGMDTEQPTISSAFTGDDGSFAFSTYETGDGVPEGEYELGFEWREYATFTGAFDGADKLEGRFKTWDNPRSTFRVTKDNPLDLGRIDLRTPTVDPTD
jgi:5-hydroxyisourate hydrolase-like protein (transthyretin family)